MKSQAMQCVPLNVKSVTIERRSSSDGAIGK
jgi:hypothetical protein